jgi:predicted nucleotidyltransferase
MDHPATPDPVLTRFRDEVRALYGSRLERVVLFGSRARGDHRPDSDFDVAVFIRDPDSRWDEMGRLALVTTELLLQDVVITALPFESGAYDNDTRFMRNVRREGIEL